MASRPIFITGKTAYPLIRVLDVKFEWYAGLSLAQKRKSISSLHEAAKADLKLESVLEISTKSDNPLGIRLSAFNLQLKSFAGFTSSVEAIFQGSKRFEKGGPFTDLYAATARQAKSDTRLRSSGPLVGFAYEGFEWPLSPMTAFYDWLYINALQQNQDAAKLVLKFDAFTDIEFNPKRSLNCQAAAAARYNALVKFDLLNLALRSPADFIDVMAKHTQHSESGQITLI